MAPTRLQPTKSFAAVSRQGKEIRLLVLLPDAEVLAPIRCKLSLTSLADDADTADYETVSYAWGRGPADQTVTVDGLPVSVSLVVVQMLRRLRDQKAERTLWIDCLCIDQSDEEEKTSQVRLMRHIYKGCTGCSIWLGVDVDDTGSASASSLHAARDIYDMIQWFAHMKTCPKSTHSKQERALAALTADTDRATAALQAWNAFMGVPWWTRIWTVQECTLPPKADVYWGYTLPPLPWDTMQAAAGYLVDNDHAKFYVMLGQGLSGGAEEAFRMWSPPLDDFTRNMRGLEIARGGEAPLDLLQRWRFRQATNARDKIYGLMGLLTKERIRDIPTARACDYTLSVEALYTYVTMELICRNRALQPLTGRAGERSRLTNMPTWAVDWQTAGDGFVTDYWEKRTLWVGYGFSPAAGLRDDNIRSGQCFRGDGTKTVLVVDEAVFVDRIAVVEDKRDTDPSNIAIMSYAEQVIHGVDRVERLAKRYQETMGRPLPATGWLRAVYGIVAGRLVPDNPDHGVDADDWIEKTLSVQALFMTEQGRIGLGPWPAMPGQEIWVAGGSRLPLIFQRLGGLDIGTDEKDPSIASGVVDRTFHGECAMYGIMMGEAVNSKAQRVEVRLH